MQLSMARKFTLRSTKSPPPPSGTKNLATSVIDFYGIALLLEKLSMFNFTENMKSMIRFKFFILFCTKFRFTTY